MNLSLFNTFTPFLAILDPLIKAIVLFFIIKYAVKAGINESIVGFRKEVDEIGKTEETNKE